MCKVSRCPDPRGQPLDVCNFTRVSNHVEDTTPESGAGAVAIVFLFLLPSRMTLITTDNMAAQVLVSMTTADC